MKIKNVNGTFWNAENGCFTHAECAATDYATVDDMPDVIEMDDTTRCEILKCGPGDIRWYPAGDYDSDGIASVVE